MKHLALVAAVAGFALAGCTHPYNYASDYVTVDPNQTAFLIALDGDSQANQMKMNSIDFLEKNRVATKRVEIPHKDVSLCPHCLTGDWQEMPSAILITIDRTPVTREWTSSERTGTSKSNQAFHVESRESIDFSIGATMTAHVTEEDAAKFLFYYGKMRRTEKGDYVASQLDDIMDTNVRSFIGSDLSDIYGQNTLDYDRANKHDIFQKVLADAYGFFKARGITIDNFGYTEGMTYTDPQIQDSINKNFAAAMQVDTAQKQVAAAKAQAEAAGAVREQQDLQMRQRELDIQQKALDKWNGVLPTTLVSSNGSLPFNIPVQVGKQ